MPSAEPAEWNIFGLVLTLPGILLLFVFGMPFHVPRHGDEYLKLHRRNKRDPWIERLFIFLSSVGLLLIVSGTSLQIWASILEITARE